MWATSASRMGALDGIKEKNEEAAYVGIISLFSVYLESISTLPCPPHHGGLKSLKP
jgi:hypothetical protein